MNSNCRGKRAVGSVLILTLWALLLLGIFAVAVGGLVLDRMAVAWDLANRSVCYHAAKAGVAAAIASVQLETNGGSGFSRDWRNDAESMKDIAVGGGVFTVFHSVRGIDGAVQTNYGVAAENGKVNINQVTNEAVYGLVKSLIRTAGNVDKAKAESIAACIADWIDGDDEPREGGAENGYYQAQNPTYECHNGRMDRVEELLLVKGMEADIFEGIADLLTVYGTNAGVNINDADSVVLRALARTREGVQEADVESFVDKVLEFREKGGVIPSLDKREIRGLLYGDVGVAASTGGGWTILEWLLNHRLVSVRSGHYCGTSAGRLPGGRAAERRIAFVFDADTGRMEAWNEE